MKLIKFILGFLILLALIMAVHAGENDPVCFGNTTTDTVCIGGDEGIVNATGEGHFVTVNTGQGNNELYAMDQGVESTDDVTFDNLTASTKFTDGTLTITSGAITGATDVNGSGELNFATINTGHGDQEVYGINTTVFVVQGDNIGIIKTWLDGLYCLLTGCTMAGDIAMGGNDITGAADVNGTGELNFATLNTGQGDYELYEMNQNVTTTSNVNFNSVQAGGITATTYLTSNGDIYTTGAGDDLWLGTSTQASANFIAYANGSVYAAGAGTFATLNTGQGYYELYAMDQDVESGDAVTFDTVDTGQGANELYDMNQNVLTNSDVTFDNVTVSTKFTDGTMTISGGSITAGVDANFTGLGNFATINTGHGAQEVYGLNTSAFVVQGDNIGVILSLWDGLYCLLTGCTMAGDIAMGGNSITGLLDINGTGKLNIATVNTGQGDNELYDMDQNVLQASDVVFNNITSTTDIIAADGFFSNSLNIDNSNKLFFNKTDTEPYIVHNATTLGVPNLHIAADLIVHYPSEFTDYMGVSSPVLDINPSSSSTSGISIGDASSGVGLVIEDQTSNNGIWIASGDKIVTDGAGTNYLTDARLVVGNITTTCITISNGAQIGACD